jgi:hypothetical protein
MQNFTVPYFFPVLLSRAHRTFQLAGTPGTRRRPGGTTDAKWLPRPTFLPHIPHIHRVFGNLKTWLGGTHHRIGDGQHVWRSTGFSWNGTSRALLCIY